MQKGYKTKRKHTQQKYEGWLTVYVIIKNTKYRANLTPPLRVLITHFIFLPQKFDVSIFQP